MALVEPQGEMMIDYVNLVRKFHLAFGQPVLATPSAPSDARKRLRRKLMGEELMELYNALEDKDIVLIADGLADLLYVVFGTALEYGIPIDKVFEEVHRSNMTKLWPDGRAHYREDGKVLKPKTFSPPRISDIFNNSGS